MKRMSHKSRSVLVASLLAVVVVAYAAISGLASVMHWEPAAYSDEKSFVNLTRLGFKWDVRYGGDSLCGQPMCRDTSKETIVSYKKVLPNQTFGSESLARDEVLFYQVQVPIPESMLGQPLGLHVLHLFANRYEFFVDDELVRSGEGIVAGYFPIPERAMRSDKPVQLTFKIDTAGMSEPGFDLRANVLLGPVAMLNQLTLEKTAKDRELVLWLTIPCFLIAFLFAFGTALFAYSRDYVFYVAYMIVSAFKVPVFYGSTRILGIKTGLTYSELFNALDLASIILMFLFVYRFYRQKQPFLRKIFLSSAVFCAGVMIALTIFTTSQTSSFYGLWMNHVLRAVSLVYFTVVSHSLYRFLRFTGRSPSRMYIAGTMAACFGLSLLALPISVALSSEYWVHVLLFELMVSCVFAACVSTEMGKVRAERDIIRQKMGVHVDEGLVEELIGTDQFIARNVAEAAILFVDIRGFTEMSESSTATEIFELLNAFHKQIIDCVYEHRGVIDKFMGDSLMAVWGVRHYDKDCVVHAAAAAIAMSHKLADLNKRRNAEGKAVINYGIAVHVGPVVAGHIGNERRAEFSVIGSAVNIASRLEGLTGRLNRKILISESVFVQIRKRAIVADLGYQKIRGITNSLQVFALVGLTEGRNDVKLVADPRYSPEVVKPWPHMIDEKDEIQLAS